LGRRKREHCHADILPNICSSPYRPRSDETHLRLQVTAMFGYNTRRPVRKSHENNALAL
jgi:hypothetical protein